MNLARESHVIDRFLQACLEVEKKKSTKKRLLPTIKKFAKPQIRSHTLAAFPQIIAPRDTMVFKQLIIIQTAADGQTGSFSELFASPSWLGGIWRGPSWLRLLGSLLFSRFKVQTALFLERSYVFCEDIDSRVSR